MKVNVRYDRLKNRQVITDGINVLHSTTARDSMLQHRLPQLCEESNALYTICLAFQLSLSSTRSPLFLEYFDTSLRKFRSELACSTTLSDGTLTAGLLLCSIGVRDQKHTNFRSQMSGSLFLLITLITANAWDAMDNSFGGHAQYLAKSRSFRYTTRCNHFPLPPPFARGHGSNGSTVFLCWSADKFFHDEPTRFFHRHLASVLPAFYT